jgi:hypothetical protein
MISWYGLWIWQVDLDQSNLFSSLYFFLKKLFWIFFLNQTIFLPVVQVTFGPVNQPGHIRSTSYVFLFFKKNLLFFRKKLFNLQYGIDNDLVIKNSKCCGKTIVDKTLYMLTFHHGLSVTIFSFFFVIKLFFYWLYSSGINWSPINSNLLSNEKIERKWIKVKKEEKTCGSFKIE